MTIGIGVIGAGVMGADHAATLAGAIGGAHLVAIADADSARANTLAQQTGALLLPVTLWYVSSIPDPAEPLVGRILAGA